MSGSTGAERVKSRSDYDKIFYNYVNIIREYPGFVSATPSGSYNSDKSKETFGDIDIIVQFDSDMMSKRDLKHCFSVMIERLPEDIILPFTTSRGREIRTQNTGEMITVKYFDTEVGYAVQIDNIFSMSAEETDFKLKFLDLPAEKQGLLLGLVKTSVLNNIELFPKLPPNFELEYNISSSELQLRYVEYIPHSFVPKETTVVWKSTDFEDVWNVIAQFDLNKSFDELLDDIDKNIINSRSRNRIVGLFKSMITVKSGEVGTPKGEAKEKALEKICCRLLNSPS